MAPLLSLGLKIGMGYAVGQKLMLKTMAWRTPPKRLPPVRVGLGLSRTANFANGMQYARNAQVYFNRGDFASAAKNIADAYKAAGIPILIGNGSAIQVAINNFVDAYKGQVAPNQQRTQRLVSFPV